MSGSNASKIDHLGIAVRSLDRALEFYRDQLGLEVSLRETVEHEQVNVAMLPLGEPRIELLEPTEPDSVIGKFHRKAGRGAASRRDSRSGPDGIGRAAEEVRCALAK